MNRPAEPTLTVEGSEVRDDRSEVEVVVTINLRGDRLATIEEAGNLTADLDALLSQRYPDIYRGPLLRINFSPEGSGPLKVGELKR